MREQEFTGHVTAMRADAEFYGAEDFIGRGDVPMQIAKVLEWKNRKACGKTQDLMFTLKFHEGTKELWLKATNRKQLMKLYGPHAAAWKDKWVWIYVEECKSPQGGQTLGLRFRNRSDAPEKIDAVDKQRKDSVDRIIRVLKQEVQSPQDRASLYAGWNITDPRKLDQWTDDTLKAASEYCDSLETSSEEKPDLY